MGITEKQLRETAIELNIAFGLDPPIHPKEHVTSLVELLKEAAKLRRPDDVFSEKRAEVTELVLGELAKYKKGESVPVGEVTPKAEDDDIFKQVETAEDIAALQEIAIANPEFVTVREKFKDFANKEALRDAMFEVMVQLKMASPALAVTKDPAPAKETPVTKKETPAPKKETPVVKEEKPAPVAVTVAPWPKGLRINPVFEKACPPLTDDEYYKLEALIIKDGQIFDPILVWNNQIIDGHNRFEIAGKTGIDFQIKEMSFKNEEEGVIWIKENAVSQRNLPEFARFEMIKEIEGLLKQKGKENQSHGVTAPGKVVTPTEKKEKHNTREEIAKKAGISASQVVKAQVIEKEAAPEVKEALRQGKTTIGKEFDRIKKKITPKETKVSPATEESDSDKIIAAAEKLEEWVEKYKDNPFLKDIAKEIAILAKDLRQMPLF